MCGQASLSARHFDLIHDDVNVRCRDEDSVYAARVLQCRWLALLPAWYYLDEGVCTPQRYAAAATAVTLAAALQNGVSALSRHLFQC